MIFFLRKLLGALTHPLSVAVLLALWALLHRRWRKRLLVAAIVVLCAFSYPLIPKLLRRPLITRYAPMTELQPGVTNIVVLCAGSFSGDASLPVTGLTSDSFLPRFFEGVRLARGIPEGRLLLSFGLPETTSTDRELADGLADLVGIDPGRVVPVSGAVNTRAEARLMRPYVGTNRFYLVTSDFHMLRAMMLFEQQGMQPIAAPAGRCGRDGEEAWFYGSELLPNAGYLRATDEAVHEYLGILWLLLRGRGSE